MNTEAFISPRRLTDRTPLLERYQRVRRQTEALAAPLTVEDCVVQTSTECSPVKWHLAHTTWFFETFVLLACDPTYSEFNSKYGYLFNSYYNTIGDRTPRPARGLMSRPTLEEVRSYRAYVDRAIERIWHSMFANWIVFLSACDSMTFIPTWSLKNFTEPRSDCHDEFNA